MLATRPSCPAPAAPGFSPPVVVPPLVPRGSKALDCPARITFPLVGLPAVPTTGINFTFTGVYLLIKNVDQNRWFAPLVSGPGGLEQLDYSTEVVGPVPAPPVVSGSNFQFALGAVLKWKHDSSGLYHRYDWVGGGLQFELGAGGLSDPGVVTPAGANFRFLNNKLEFKDSSDGLYYAPVLYGPVASQEWGYL